MSTFGPSTPPQRSSDLHATKYADYYQAVTACIVTSVGSIKLTDG